MERTTEKPKVTVIRPGRFATALAVPLSENAVVTFCFESSEANTIFQKTRENQKYHPGVKLFDVQSTDNMKKGLMGADIVLLAVPMIHLRTTCKSLKPYGIEDKQLCVGTKGLEIGTNYRPSQVVLDVIPRLSKTSYAAISGPNIAREMIRKLPAVTVIASKNDALIDMLLEMFSTGYLFPYRTDDLEGAELGGALKNPVAMVAGIGDGLGLGGNAIAALQNRGWREATRLAVVLGADERTLNGPSGAGDLAVSCRPGGGGRNYDAGVAIGRGEDPRILQKSGQTIEGFNTIGPAIVLARKNGVQVPVLEGLGKVIRKERPPSYINSLLIEENNRYSDPEPIIDRRVMRWVVRKINRFSHLWRNAT